MSLLGSGRPDRPAGGSLEEPPDDSAQIQHSGDAELLQRLHAYDVNAIQTVYRLHADGVYRYALYQSGDPALAEDVAGEVFVRMLESVGSYRYRGSPISAWLYRIARNLVIDHQRRDKRLRPLENIDESRHVSDNPIKLAEDRLSWDELRETLGFLTEEQRQVLILKFVENFDNREVAEIVGKTEGSVKSLQHRALRSLRRVLEQRGMHARQH